MKVKLLSPKGRKECKGQVWILVYDVPAQCDEFYSVPGLAGKDIPITLPITTEGAPYLFLAVGDTSISKC